MKLVVIIPAFNEAQTIAEVIAGIPQTIEHINTIQVIVVNDGSSDATQAQAQAAGATVISHQNNLGLAQAFRTALDAALAAGADIIVNIDADGQQDQSEISQLIAPIIANQAGMVIGNRNITTRSAMHRGKKYGNILGDKIVGLLSGVSNIDVSSGFRAFSREAALRLTVFFGHTYTHQTVIEAAYKHIKIASVPITVTSRTQGESKVVTNIFTHISRSVFIIIRTLLMYRPLKTCLSIGTVFIGFGVLLVLYFLVFY